jgi:hypothetical protein
MHENEVQKSSGPESRKKEEEITSPEMVSIKKPSVVNRGFFIHNHSANCRSELG